MTRVSVLMAVWNSAGVVGRAVDSILRQSYPDWELLVVDDASTDETALVLQAVERREPRVRVLRNRSNLGLAGALNRGWNEARGDLIARMDADDTSHPERLAHQVRFLDAHPEVAVLGSGAEMVDDDGHFLGLAVRPECHEELAARMYRESPFLHPSVMFRRSFLAAMDGYDERLRRAQDLDLWLRAYRRFRFHNLQKPLITYRLHGPPSLEAMLFATFVLGRAAYREGRLLTHGRYAVRYLISAMLGKLGIRRQRL
jgi:glycosyltransferase involved in cell wall biosynthesis